MAKKPADTTETTTAPTIDPVAYYRVIALGRFRAFGVGFGPTSDTRVTGAILTRLLDSEFAGKVAGWTPV